MLEDKVTTVVMEFQPDEDYIELVESKNGQIGWHRKARNHETISQGEQHRDGTDARRAAVRAAQPIWSLVTDEDLFAEYERRIEKA